MTITFRGFVQLPYKNVIKFKRENGNGLCACICEDCLDELYKKSNELFKKQRID